MEKITGNDIRTGDVIRSAAMRQPLRVKYVRLSSTGHTVEVACEIPEGWFASGARQHAAGTWTYRIGLFSVVKRYEMGEAVR